MGRTLSILAPAQLNELLDVVNLLRHFFWSEWVGAEDLVIVVYWCYRRRSIITKVLMLAQLMRSRVRVCAVGLSL